jgi:hypothetical protein
MYRVHKRYRTVHIIHLNIRQKYVYENTRSWLVGEWIEGNNVLICTRSKQEDPFYLETDARKE